jgi:hypothetical protein
MLANFRCYCGFVSSILSARFLSFRRASDSSNVLQKVLPLKEPRRLPLEVARESDSRGLAATVQVIERRASFIFARPFRGFDLPASSPGGNEATNAWT